MYFTRLAALHITGLPPGVLASRVHDGRGVELNRPSPHLASALVAAIAAFVCGACTSTSTSTTAPSSSKCAVSASAAPLQFAAGGGTGQLTISAARECSWSIDSPAEWVGLSGDRAGNGSVTLPFTVASNPVPTARSADLLVDDVRLGVTQAAAPCMYSLKRTRDSIGAAGGTLPVEIVTLTGCSWSAASAASWLTLSRTTGQSSGNVELAVAANAGPARSGSITLGGQTYTVMQDAVTTPTPTPTPNPTPAPTPAPTPPPPPTPPPAPAPAPTPTPLPTPDPSGPVSLSGTVSDASGSCPSRRFRLDGRDVVTDNATDFTRGKCRNLSDGDRVKVSGFIQSSGDVLATDIEITQNEK